MNRNRRSCKVLPPNRVSHSRFTVLRNTGSMGSGSTVFYLNKWPTCLTNAHFKVWSKRPTNSLKTVTNVKKNCATTCRNWPIQNLVKIVLLVKQMFPRQNICLCMYEYFFVKKSHCYRNMYINFYNQRSLSKKKKNNLYFNYKYTNFNIYNDYFINI